MEALLLLLLMHGIVQRQNAHNYLQSESLILYNVISRDAPDIRPDNPAFFDIRYPAGLHCRISGLYFGTTLYDTVPVQI
jgi:hypothetical protein